MRNFIASYRDLPVYIYQFQNKLRNELRAKSGVMRCREFVMKDLYSFSLDFEQHQKFYDEITAAYHRVFDRLGLGDSTYFTFASGGAFTEFSHEFQTICDSGEDTIYLDRAKKIAVNEEVMRDDVLQKLGLKKSGLEKLQAAEVGNIFSFGGTKSEQLGLHYADESGKKQPVILGSYGIGITRLMGVLAEKFADERGLVWPEAVAPAQAIVVPIGDDKKVSQQAELIFQKLAENNIGVILDDRQASPGEKLADGDLLGIPHRIVISPKTLDKGKIELKYRKRDKIDLIEPKNVLSYLSGSKAG
jgi:prolyl-tRNA synthetase